MAVIIVEHRIELLSTIADRVMVMDAGEVSSPKAASRMCWRIPGFTPYFEPEYTRARRRSLPGSPVKGRGGNTSCTAPHQSTRNASRPRFCISRSSRPDMAPCGSYTTSI